jgi:hypothetical protein
LRKLQRRSGLAGGTLFGDEPRRLAVVRQKAGK